MSGLHNSQKAHFCHMCTLTPFISLGSFGFHKFYLGQIGMGVLYLLLCWTFIPSVLGIIEGILLLIMSDEDFNRKYGTI